MTKYLVLYRSPASARQQMASATPEQQKAGMDMWMAWSKRAAANLVDLGAPVGSVAQLGAKVGSDDIGGFSILQGDSVDQIRAVLDGHPHLHMPGGTIDVLELLEIPGM